MPDTTCHIHLYGTDFENMKQMQNNGIRILPNPGHGHGFGKTYAEIHIGKSSVFLNESEYREAIAYFSRVVSELRAAHHKATHATGERLAVNIGLLVSGGDSCPSDAEVAEAFRCACEDSRAFESALKGHNVDNLVVSIASLP